MILFGLGEGRREKSSPQSSQRGLRGRRKNEEKRPRGCALDRKNPPIEKNAKGGHPQVLLFGGVGWETQEHSQEWLCHMCETIWEPGGFYEECV